VQSQRDGFAGTPQAASGSLHHKTGFHTIRAKMTSTLAKAGQPSQNQTANSRS
jgi:hypothetical protein